MVRLRHKQSDLKSACCEFAIVTQKNSVDFLMFEHVPLIYSDTRPPANFSSCWYTSNFCWPHHHTNLWDVVCRDAWRQGQHAAASKGRLRHWSWQGVDKHAKRWWKHSHNKFKCLKISKKLPFSLCDLCSLDLNKSKLRLNGGFRRWFVSSSYIRSKDSP